MSKKKSESFPEVQYVDSKLFEVLDQQSFRLGILNNPRYRALILEGFGFSEVTDFGVDDDVSFSSCSWMHLAKEYISNDPEDIFRMNSSFSGQIIDCQLLPAEDAYRSVGRDVIQNLPRKLIGIKAYDSLTAARSDIEGAFEFLGLGHQIKNISILFPFENIAFSKALDFINGCVYHYQNNYSGLDTLAYIRCAESFAQDYFKKLSHKENKIPSTFSPYVFGSFAKNFSMIQYQANNGSSSNPDERSKPSVSSRAIYKIFVKSLGHQVSEKDSNCLIELLHLRQVICASNPFYLPDPTMQENEHMETFTNATKTINSLGAEYLYDTKSLLDEDTSELIEGWSERGCAHSINYVSKIDNLLINKYGLDKLIGIG